MGVYLGLGIVNGLEIEKHKRLEDINVAFEEMGVDKNLYYLFDNHEKFYKFRLKKEILKDELIPFLEELWEYFYKREEETIKKQEIKNKIEEVLKSDNFEGFENIYSYMFQLVSSQEPEYIKLPFGEYSRIYYKSFIFYSEGKIMMETYGGCFDFLQKMVQQNFSQYKLSKAFKVSFI